MEVTEPLAQESSNLPRLPSLVRGRPPLPQGPRIRQPSGATHITLSNSVGSSVSSPIVANDDERSLSNTRQLPSPNTSLALITETLTNEAEQEEYQEEIPPTYQDSDPPPVVRSPLPVHVPPTTTSLGVLTDIGIQAGPSPPLTPATEAKLAVKIVPKPVALTPPPQLSFESQPISIKGLSLNTAQWTLTSAELQDIVSRAIRLSARESFIRVLPVETLDQKIPEENERLDNLKMITQSKYRFQVHRRTMLLQALNSSATSTPHDPQVVCHLAGQLSETTTTCDRLMEELLKIADQQAQLKKVLEWHWASALAIALRKINKSYERKVGDLKAAQDRIEILEAELEEAWMEAETMAREMDNLESAVSDDDLEDGADGKAQPAFEDNESRPSAEFPVDVKAEDEAEDGGGDGDGEVDGDAGIITPVTGTAKVAEPKLISSTSPRVPEPPEAAETTSPGSPNASRSRRNSHQSTRSERSNRWNRVVAAKTRSRRTSNASLRVTARSRSKASRGTEDRRERPPVPDLPDSFLDLGTANGWQGSNDTGKATRIFQYPRESS